MAEKEYIERDALCYQLAKQATIDGQPRAIRRAAKIVADFPAADVRPVVLCRDCKYHVDNKCLYHIRFTNEDDYCSSGKKREEN